MPDGSIAAVAFNRGKVNATIAITWQMIGLEHGASAKVRDLWAHQDMGGHTGSYSCEEIGPHDVCALRIMSVQKP